MFLNLINPPNKFIKFLGFVQDMVDTAKVLSLPSSIWQPIDNRWKLSKIVLIGEYIKYRTFNGANKALPVLASSLVNAGFNRVIQLDLERPDLTIDHVLHEVRNADLIIFAGCLTTQWQEIDEHSKKVFTELKKHGRKNVPILVGGYATKSVKDIAQLTPWITGFCDGEGEESIVEIAYAVAKGNFYRNMKHLPGLCFMNKDKEFYRVTSNHSQPNRFHHSIAPRVENFDDIDQNLGLIHIPQIHNMDIFKTKDGRQLKTAQIFTQRGCPWGCGFCNKSQENNHIVRLSEASFRQQLRQLKQRGYEAVYLDVDTFTAHVTAAKKEAEILKQEGFVWGSNTRIDKIDYEQMRYLVEHNCVYMFFGVEHSLPEVSLANHKFNGSIQSQIKQAFDYPSNIKKAFQDMNKAGLPSSYFLILGLPKAKLNEDKTEIIGYEPTTLEDDLRTIRFGLEECHPDFLNFNILRFMPGSFAADTPGDCSYSCVRPSGNKPITAGYFLQRAVQQYGYPQSPTHGVYRLCESVGRYQPISTAINPQRVYDTICYAMQLINAKIDAGGKATKLFIDKDLLTLGLVSQDEQGRYAIAPLEDFARV
ncbi:Cobalamin B12-binding protein [Trichormus variabilis ATCC 29413]|uniref:Cobalamin B12-binding protein n=3 Tax=Nostocales TaxID=1161 RepID=Q3M9U2_TRIV2|nr:radical SAM protein [Trichormus variabilis]MBC1267106.1 B12-binding domain-containing radical SAM protein [Trichormus variabilis FSR]MBC1309729.1 B12-binding domain-containing radical SAM protein [Trichormus variabilis PNB]MBD2382238.1 B12-binding domain-containing radical SAM protein [Trichormus variabilis FACHB-319]QFZ11804.1 B12-binding domain-containing radical SAM protein [Anabaena sp. YBS01]ABA22244.1 Cobalamin B12-binding protein [Trichormus variabilis ATCC 29413]